MMYTVIRGYCYLNIHVPRLYIILEVTYVYINV